jgi:chromosome segregation ATPase
MTNKYEELINAFEIRLRKLFSEYKSLQDENNQLRADLDRKQNELMHAHQEVLELRKKCDHLKMAGNLSGSESDRSEAKNKIAKMVREIDKCIALLDE